MIIASGMGGRAQGLFGDQGIEVLLGVSGGSPDEIVASYLKGTLQTGENVCER
jgi:predicted Fe-Mo cluster-binding NifX family protein